jgi:hypothetical protein
LFSSKSRDFGAFFFSQNRLYECPIGIILCHQVVKRIVFLKQKKMGEFWIFVSNVNLTNCSKFFDIKKFKNKIKIPFSKMTLNTCQSEWKNICTSATQTLLKIT